MNTYTYFFRCSFELINDKSKILKLNSYNEAKNYGAIACNSEIASIASDIVFDKYRFDFSRSKIKSVEVIFDRRDLEIYGKLNINTKDKKLSKSDINDIKSQFISIEDRSIQVHNFATKDKTKYRVMLIINDKLEDKLWKD